MRVQEMFYLINHALETWVEPIFTEHKNRNGDITAYSCKNAPKLVELLEPLRPFPEINKQIELIYSTHETFYKGTPGSLTSGEAKKILGAAEKIKSSLLTMQSMCIALGLEQDSSGFDIKLPPNMSLAELSECTKDLNNVFVQCPLLHNEYEEVKLRGVDVGSMWLTFAIIGASAATCFYIANNLAAMVDKIITIREHMAVLKQQEELARQAGLKSAALQTIVDANKEITKSLVQSAAEELAGKNNITAPDDIEHIRGPLDMLKAWMDKGMEMYASVDAPDEIKAAFPPLDMQTLPNFEAKELAAHKNSGEE